jgi:hypothetical protein
MTQLMRRHPLVTFFLLVFIITWVVWVPRASGGAPLGVVGQAWTWAPAIAALLAAALTGGRGALRELGACLVRWRVGCKCISPRPSVAIDTMDRILRLADSRPLAYLPTHVSENVDRLMEKLTLRKSLMPTLGGGARA